jgi:hypothetical protein
MTRAIVLLLALLFFKAVLPRRERRTIGKITPYGSVFDVAVPADLACSPLCDPAELATRTRRQRLNLQDRHS